ncbi:EAL domain-containing protein [Prauserella muralis]|uniref:Diguanylate cyclase n=1 Tax=Prauserella muralis TaxID=588067 RepID=A0A2V4AIT7_9PSEU|nr:EAL domain-containing protein [Prauserella muralis]PXY19096.1 diguanylate cyclase [Prauserella muralis]TWE28999.1 PAS domain S-box-containing protein/diguanylate cyclase (GGDEF)-like protein [Prauserella muralis]
MPEPGDTPGTTGLARRWAARLADTNGVELPADELERILTAVAAEARAEAEAARDAAVHRLATLYSASPHGVALTDQDGRILDVNPAFTRILGHKPEDLAGTDAAALAATEHEAETIRSAFAELRADGRQRHREQLELDHVEDGPLRTNVTIAGLPGDREGSLYPVLIVEDVSELHLLRDTLRRQNVQDPLTGLPNHSSFVNKLEATLAAPGDGQLALIYFDIDGFKVVNDGLGPGAGDEVLRHVARTLAAAFAGHDAFVARLSGDGFAVLMHGELSSAGVIDLVEDAMRELAEPCYVDGNGVAVSVSVGIVVQDAAGQTQEDLHRAAEITLHRAKENGRAQWMLFEPDLDHLDRRRYGIGAVIGGALENGEFELEYQPTVKLDGSNEVAVVNAVLRWRHPEHGVLKADEFYPLADTTGMTANLGRWLLTESMAEAASWHEQFSAAPDLCVRLPTRMAIDPNLVGIIRTELEQTKLPPDKLRLCTDSIALFDPRGEVPEALAVLSELDVKITLAVSGAADLELAHANKLPVGYVILSGPLVDALAREGPEADGARKHLVTLMERACELGIRRIGAEGVHTPEHASRLRELGIVAGRGELFGRAASGAEIRSLIEQHGPR